jgi:hypothetical protein
MSALVGAGVGVALVPSLALTGHADVRDLQITPQPTRYVGLPPEATPAKPSRRTTARSAPNSRAREIGDQDRTALPREAGSGRVLAVFGRSLHGYSVEGPLRAVAGWRHRRDTGSGLPDQRLRLGDRYAPGRGSLPAESGTRCPARPDGRFASKSALHPAWRVLTSSQRS